MNHAGKYQLLSVVADHPNGRIWRGLDPELNRPVAVKQVDLGDALAAERLRSEGRVLASLDNEHVVAVYDVVEAEGTIWLVEEWVDGAALDAVLARARRLSAEQAVGVVRGALLGLAAAHQQDVVHGDVSPGNIVLDRAGVSKLVDFGLAGRSGQPGVSGTPGYLSPEVARGLPVTPRSDVYSAAVVLASLLLGKPLFPVTTTVEALGREVSEVPPDLTGVSGRMGAVLAKALQRDPLLRQADAAELLADLEEAAEQEYGAGWLAQAGVAGLVAAAVTAGVVGVALPAKAAAHPASQGARSAARRGATRGLSRTQLLAVGGTVVVVAAVAVAAVAASGGSPRHVALAPPKSASPTTPAASAAPSSPAAGPSLSLVVPSTAAAPTVANRLLGFSGSYHVVDKATGTKGDFSKILFPFIAPTSDWQVAVSCTPTCAGFVRSSTGDVNSLVYSHGEWRSSGIFTLTCFGNGNAKIPALQARLTEVVTFPTTATAATRTFQERNTVTVVKDDPLCSLSKGDYFGNTGVLTRA